MHVNPREEHDVGGHYGFLVALFAELGFHLEQKAWRVESTPCMILEPYHGETNLMSLEIDVMLTQSKTRLMYP